MIKILALMFLSAEVFAQGSAQVRAGLMYESNTFYSDEGAESDFAFVLEPSGEYQKQVSSSYTVTTKGDLLYTKYGSFSEQDFFEYSAMLGNMFSVSSKWKFYLNPNTKLESEPAIGKSRDRLERQFFGADTGLIYKKDESRQWIFNVSYLQESLSQSLYEYLNNAEMRALITYRKYFLPETFAAFVLRMGMKSYPDGDRTSVAAFKKYDSTRIEPGFAVVGKITRYFKIRAYAGFVYLTYAKEEGFKEPVFLIEFEEELSPKDTIIVGYDYSVEDTYHGNYLLMQKMYIGYGRFLGDQVLLTTNLEYLHRFFSQPYRRNDQRFFLTVRGEYSYSQNLKYEIVGAYDLNSSDSFNNLPITALPNPVDKAVSYENYSLGIFAKYLF